MSHDQSEKPIPPGDYECCESACDPCVWDTYYEELREWQAAQQALSKAAESAAAQPDTTEADT